MNYINNLNTIFLIITHKPDDNIFDIIKEINTINFRFIIVDNSEQFNVNIEQIKNSNPGNYIIYNKNINGISRAFNIGFNKAINNNFDYVITLDQDSLFDSNLIYNYNLLYNKLKYKIGAIGVNHKKNNSNRKLNFIKTFELINSGTLINCEAYKKVGGYDEKYFIDNVDFDFFLRMNIKNYKTFKILNYSILHKLGSPITLNYFLFKVNFAKYPAIRLYHYAFSNIYFFKKYIFIRPFFSFKKLFFFLIYLFQSFFIYNNFELKNIFLGLKNAYKIKPNG